MPTEALQAAGPGPARQTTVIRPPSFPRLNLRRHLLTLPQYGDLFLTLSLHRIKVRYKQSVLGASWAILQPLTMMLIFTFIFTFIIPGRAPGEGVPYPLFAYAGLLAWMCCSTGLTNSVNGLVSHASLVTKVYFPREIIPLTYVLVALGDFAIASVALGVLMVGYGVAPTLQALWAVPVLVVLTALVTAAGLLLSALQVRFRDVGMAVPLALQIGMFASPVIYPLSAVPERLYPFYILNPLVGVIENFRRAVVLGVPPDFPALAVSTAAAAVLLPLAYVYFKYAEATMADVI